MDLLEKLENMAKENKFPSISEAIRAYVELGMHTESLKSVIKDPEFLKSIEELKQNDGVFKWIEALNNQQVDAIAYALQMEKEKRFENRSLR